MELTGKAKEAFEQWVLYMHHEIRFRSLIKIHNQRDLFVSYDDIPGDFLNTLIIEWLDSVGIYVSIEYIYGEHFSCCVEALEQTEFTNGDTRQQATEKAIEMAVEIYNSK
ncbi:hypothetical protein [Sphingobacterium lactis]|uniref:hypothetical protein n=1 Tax=Sphingobacterium lactis TaxID=797291 RepID=UPI003DA5FAF8